MKKKLEKNIKVNAEYSKPQIVKLSSKILYINYRKVKIRREYFGSLLFDKNEYNYFALDTLATDILKEFALGMKVDNVLKKFYRLISLENFYSLIQFYCNKKYLVSKKNSLGQEDNDEKNLKL